MNYSIPKSSQDIIALRQPPISEELVASAIAGVIQIARIQQQSLEDLKAELLADDHLLSVEQRLWLSDLVIQAWNSLPSNLDAA